MVSNLSLAIVAAGVLAAAGTAARAGLRQGILVLLDFLLAAGLLRLSSSGLGWRDIGSITLIVAIRHLVTFGLAAHRWALQGAFRDVVLPVRSAARPRTSDPPPPPKTSA